MAINPDDIYGLIKVNARILLAVQKTHARIGLASAARHLGNANTGEKLEREVVPGS